MKTVGIIDYGMCNLDSIARAVEECGARPVVTSRAEDLKTVASFILPGVGAFADAMANLHKLELPEFLHEQVMSLGIPLLGICLGMQLLATRSFEGAETRGLGWIEGDVCRLVPTRLGERVPHVGWNEVHLLRPCPLFERIPTGKDFYFVHSYHFRTANPEDALGTTDYCGGFTSVVGRDRIFGVQFHPEKSQKTGFAVLRNFLAL